MGMMDHWHPVLKSSELGAVPVGVCVAGISLALFRTAGGSVAAVADECPHRRMRLSRGEVVRDRLQCRYHGWTFDAAGQGESPGTPRLKACVTAFDAVERQGAIWIKPQQAAPAFPTFEVEGYSPVGTLRHRAPAPLELVLDNFCEIEHTPTTHAVFGYDLSRMHEVDVRFETTDDTVRVINRGPSKPMGRFLHTIIGVGKGYEFNDDWTTHFSPVYSVYDHWWSDPATGREAMVRWRLYIFFTPVDDSQTELMTFAFVKSRWPGPAGGVRLFGWLMRKHLDREIHLDLEILGGLANYETGIEGLKLSRFDRVLGLNRERLERVYRGRASRLAVLRPPAFPDSLAG
jgi:phenylpropionate dioxygenase-like ring-hydroxylating dioxygenase large terminal subunit